MFQFNQAIQTVPNMKENKFFTLSPSDTNTIQPIGSPYHHCGDVCAPPSSISPLSKAPSLENSPIRSKITPTKLFTPTKTSTPSSPITPPSTPTQQDQLMQQVMQLLPKVGEFKGIPTLPEAAVFRPTEEEFKDPMKYIASIREIGHKYGICKIVPPSDKWLQGKNLHDVIQPDTFLFPTKVQNVYQLQNRHGPYSQFMEELTKFLKERKISYKSVPTIEGKQVNLFKLYRAVIRRGGFQPVSDSKKWKAVAGEINMPESTSVASSLKQLYLKLLYELELYHVAKAQGVTDDGSKSKSKKRNNSEDSDESDDDFGYADGKYFTFTDFEDYANNFKKKVFPDGSPSPREIESAYWRTIELADDFVRVLYGSDVEVATYGSGFPNDPDHLKKASGWNLNLFATLPGSVFHYLGEKVSGVTIPMMYVGMLFSTFCWHTEDNYLYSINYLHHGAPKTWYGIPAYAAEKFEEVMKREVPDLFASQPNLLFMLVTMISPRVLRECGVPVYTTTQNPGEFMLTFPKGYHAGFSHGFNCAESCNFALDDWIPFNRECVERYRMHSRPSVLSIEKLLLKAANTPGAIEHIPNLAMEISAITTNEASLRKKILTDGIWKCVNFDNFSEDPNQLIECSACKFDCYLSGVVCPCAPNRVVCLRHAELTCDCESDRKFLLFRYKLSELNDILTNLGWTSADSLNQELQELRNYKKKVKVAGKGINGSKQHRTKQLHELSGVSKSEIRKLARIAGITKLKDVTYSWSNDCDSEMYIAEKIIDLRSFRGKVEYQVKWEGFSEEESTWIPSPDFGIKFMIEQHNNTKRGVVTRRTSSAGMTSSNKSRRMMSMRL